MVAPGIATMRGNIASSLSTVSISAWLNASGARARSRS